MQKVEINEELLNSYDPKKVFDEFKDTMNQHGNFKEMKLWIAMCSKNIIAESETRKGIKKLCKDVTIGYLNDAEIGKHKDLVTEEDYDTELKEVLLREKYWNYFRTGSQNLLRFMTTFTNKINELEELIDNPNAMEQKEKEREKIKLYIVELEKEIESNLNELNRIRLAINEFERENKAAKQKPKFDSIELKGNEGGRNTMMPRLGKKSEFRGTVSKSPDDLQSFEKKKKKSSQNRKTVGHNANYA